MVVAVTAVAAISGAAISAVVILAAVILVVMASAAGTSAVAIMAARGLQSREEAFTAAALLPTTAEPTSAGSETHLSDREAFTPR